MIQKTIVIKTAAAVIGAAAIAGTVVAVRHMSQVKDSYRSILLYEIQGTAEIEREGTGTFNGTENLYLESGDQLTVEPESFTRLRLDEDKYVMVEENSALSIEAAGTKEDSRTKINLTKGAIVNEIQNPLSAGSTYEVTTPNSIMAVRGTIFRVEIYYDENGELYTKVTVFDGQVSSRLIYPDGTMEEEVLTGNGKEVIIHSNQELTEYLGEERDIKYDEIPEDVLSVIQKMMNNAGIIWEVAGEKPKESETAKETKSSQAAESTKEEKSSQEAEDTKEEKGAQKETAEKESGAGRKAEEGRAGEAIPAGESPAVPENVGETSMASTETIPSGEGQKKIGPGYSSSDNSGDWWGSSYWGGSGSSGGGSSSGGSGSSGGESSSSGNSSSGGSQTGERPTEATTEAPTETSPEVPTEPTTEVPTESTTEAPTESTTEAPTEPSTEAPTQPTTEAPTETSAEAPTEPAVYTVTFTYNNGTVFGTQQVEEGQCAAEPWLKPERDGSWNFNFSDPVTDNIEIQWNSGG